MIDKITKGEAKHISEVLKAYSEGNTIQCKHKTSNENWWNLAKEPDWDFKRFDYRIKPTPILRPYENAEEFLQAQKEHGPYIKEGGNIKRYLNPVMIFDDHIIFWFSNNSINFKYSDLVGKQYCWQDGAPCGIYKFL